MKNDLSIAQIDVLVQIKEKLTKKKILTRKGEKLMKKIFVDALQSRILISIWFFISL